MEPKEKVETCKSMTKFEMPECWNDDMKMNYLFSPFREPFLNPLDWGNKMKFWSPLIESWCIYHNQPMFTVSSLKEAFRRKGNSPACLATVIENMHKNGDLTVFADFVQIPQQTWTAWTVDLLVKKPVFWAFNKVKESVLPDKTDTDDIKYVHNGVCKNLGETVLATIDASYTHQLRTLSEFTSICNYENQEQMLVVLHGLRRQRKAAMKEDTSLLIKLGDSNINELDYGVYSLRLNEETLTKHLEQLEAEKESVVKDAKVYVSKNMKQAARNCLRKKHVLEKCMAKRAAALENVHLLLSHLHEAKFDAKVLESYKIGLEALRTSLKGSGLTEDSAADTMLQVEEVLDVHKEIQSAMSKPVEEEEDLEEELAELLKPKPSFQSADDSLEKRLESLSVIKDLPTPPVSDPMKSLYPKLPTMEPAV